MTSYPVVEVQGRHPELGGPRRRGESSPCDMRDRSDGRMGEGIYRNEPGIPGSGLYCAP
jgi:hypothetical protein